jgi:hypothetical protein
MKNKLIASSFALAAGLLTLNSCATNGLYNAKGTVQKIELGKDGYTATLKGEDGKDFDAVISVVKLQKKYQVLKAGETVKLYGDTIHLDQKVRIIVQKIK